MVSIIIPVKNEAKNLPVLLSSIRVQKGQKEVIVVDTGSTDKTIEIAKKLGARVYRKGPERSAARNYGAIKARGRYLLFLDADMELTKGVLEDTVRVASKYSFKGLVIPERTVGDGFVARVRKFEREMYMGDLSIEVARFFDKKVFFESGGYDPKLTGPEDYDLPYRISKKYKIGRSNKYILHHEESLTLWKLLKKKYYYANKGAYYAKKHPELVMTQGSLIFRKAYLRHWRKFVKDPFLGASFIVVRFMETIFAVSGFIKAVGPFGFLNTLARSLVK